MHNRTSLCLLIVSFSASAVLHAAEPLSRHLRGVTAGVTKQSELEKNDHWGKQLSKTTKPDGSTWIEYRFWAWKKVTAVVRAGVVQTIDVLPPDRLPAEKLAETLKLGQLTPVESRKSLGPRAFVGSSASEDWQVFRCSNAPGVLVFAEMSAGKQYAKLIRFYSLGPAQQITNSIGMKLKLIPAGEFIMGSPKDEKHRRDNERQHRVRITKPFYLGIYEVTQRQYKQMAGGTTPSVFDGRQRWRPPGYQRDFSLKVAGMDTSEFPVDNVTWQDALKFCSSLSDKEGVKYRLPTEAEWEYACRAGTTTAYHFGDRLSASKANCDGKYGDSTTGVFLNRTTRVGSYPPNRVGLYDMHGNVVEWCQDWCDREYYAKSPMTNPVGPATGKSRVTRGGCWYSHAGTRNEMIDSSGGARAADRSAQRPGVRTYIYGFRVVREVDYGKKPAGMTNAPAEGGPATSPTGEPEKKTVSGALGKALLRTFGGDSAEEPVEAPAFQPR